MRYLQTKAYKIVKLIIEWELYRLSLKYIINNMLLPHQLRQFALLSLTFLPLQSTPAFLKLRCLFSNQSKSILTLFKVNRMRFKFLMSKAKLSGVRKASW